MPSLPGSSQVQQHQVRLLLRHQARHLLRVAGNDGRVARLGQGVADVPQRLGARRPPPGCAPASLDLRTRDLWKAGAGSARPADRLPLHHRNREGEPGPQARTVALRPDAAPVGLRLCPLQMARPRPDPPAPSLPVAAAQRNGRTSGTGAAAGPPALPGPRRRRRRRRGPPPGRRPPGWESLRAIAGPRWTAGCPCACTMRRRSARTQGRSGDSSMRRSFPPPPLWNALLASSTRLATSGGFGTDRQGARLDARHVQQAPDEVVHPVGLQVDDAEELDDLGRAPGRTGRPAPWRRSP